MAYSEDRPVLSIRDVLPLHIPMSIAVLLIVLPGILSADSQKNALKEVFSWKLVDYEFPSNEVREAAIESGEFIQTNSVPVGLEVWEDKLFITVPRVFFGSPSSLNYVSLSGDKSPLLRPYPNWETNNVTEGDLSMKIISTYRIRADECDRLWVMDCGIISDNQSSITYPPKVFIFDLRTDELIRIYQLKPTDYTKDNNFFANMVVDVDKDKCEDAYAYLADHGGNGLVVYDFKENDSWRVSHAFFNFDPLFTNYIVGGVNFQWPMGLFGISLSPREADGYRYLYFHPMSSTLEFRVSSKIVQNRTIASNSYDEYKVWGWRGPKSQALSSFMDPKTGVIFYTQIQWNGVSCWNSKKYYKLSSPFNTALVASDNERMIFPNDVKVDRNNNLWVLTDRLPIFAFKNPDPNDINFRVFTAPVADVIRNTVCEP